MSAFLFAFDPFYRALSATGAPMPGAILRFSVSPGTTPTDPYSDPALTTPVSTTNGAGSATADSGGLFPAIYLDSEITYRVRLYTSAGVLIRDQDVYEGLNLTQDVFNEHLAASDPYKRTTAEISAGVTPTNYAIPNHVATNGIFYPERYGNNATPGTTPMSAIIQSAISVATAAGGGEVRLSNVANYLGTTAVTIPANVRITQAQGGTVTVDSSTPASMPQAYFLFTGSNSALIGVKGVIGSNPFSTYAAKGAFCGLGANNLSNIRVEDCDSTWFMHHYFSSHIAASTGDSAVNVTIKSNRSTCFATDVYHTGKAPVNLRVLRNTWDGTRATPSNNAGGCQIIPGIDLANPSNFSQTNYDTDCGVGVLVAHNVGSPDIRDRPIRVMNCKRVKVHDNHLNLGKGTFFLPTPGETYSGDALTLDLCRQFDCHDNIVEGGGENGIDLLGCQDGRCHHNTVKQCNTTGIYVDSSDLWAASSTSPKLDLITTRTSLQTSNIEVDHNFVEAFYDMIVAAGQNVEVHNNQWKLFRASTNWVSASEPAFYSIQNSNSAAFFTESAAYRMANIRFHGNQPILVPPVSVTADSGTDLFTTVGGVAHGFVTGDKVETVAGGSGATVDYPGAVDYKVEYYIIYASATTFQIATSWANAFAGTEVNISSNGLGVSGSALLFREAVRNCIIDISASYYTPASNLQLDENIPGYTTVSLFSTLSILTPGTALLFKNFKHEFIYDPAVNYGTTRNTHDKYLPIDPVASNGTTVFGISSYSLQSGGYQFVTGADPANITGSPGDGYIKTSMW